MTRISTAILVVLAILSLQFQAIAEHHRTKLKAKQEYQERRHKENAVQCKARWPLGGERLKECLSEVV